MSGSDEIAHSRYESYFLVPTAETAASHGQDTVSMIGNDGWSNEGKGHVRASEKRRETVPTGGWSWARDPVWARKTLYRNCWFRRQFRRGRAWNLEYKDELTKTKTFAMKIFAIEAAEQWRDGKRKEEGMEVQVRTPRGRRAAGLCREWRTHQTINCHFPHSLMW